MKKSKKQMKKKVVMMLLIFLSIMVPRMLFAADAYTIITNPGEDASKEMRIGWHTDLGVEGCFVEFTKKSDTNWSNAKKVNGDYTISTTWDGIDTRVGANRFTQEIKLNKYGAVLSGLKPNTEYMYRVGKNNLSEIRYFKTAGAKEFSFAWISDYHHYDPLPNRLVNAMTMISKVISTTDGVDFILSTGDDIAYGGSYSYWKDLFANNHYSNYMWVTLNGNHDNMDMTDSKNSPAYFRDTHNNPRNGYSGQEGVSYWFKYGNVLWIVLNTEDLNNAAQVPKAQSWAAEVIRKNPSQYIFFAQHYQWFSGNTGAYSGNGFTRWNAFFDKWGVDLALGGNEHIYVRTLPLYNQQVSSIPGKGTVYLQAPSSDGDRGATMNPTLTSNADKIASRWTAGLPTVGGSVVTVSESGIKVALYDIFGTRHDYAEIVANRPPIHLLPPVVTAVAPEDLNSVKVGMPLEITFSGKMNRASVESAISFSPNANVSFSWSNDNTVAIDISQLNYSTNYTLTIDGSKAKNSDSGKFIDGANNGTEGSNYVMNFTTKEQDFVIPAVVSYDPRDAQQESIRPIVRLEFNKFLDQSSIAPNQITVKDSHGAVIEGSLSYAEVNGKSVLHFIFNSDLTPAQNYTVTLASGIKCHNGNKMVNDYIFSFTPRPRKTEKTTIIQPFTSISTWGNGGQLGGHVAVSHELDKNISPKIDIMGSLKMNYQWLENTSAVRRWRLNNGAANASLPKFSRTDHNTVQFYLFGDGSNTKFTIVLQRSITSINNTFYGKFIEMDWVGWKKITWDLNDDTGLFYPLLGGEGSLPETDDMCMKCLYVEAAPDQYLKFTPSSFWVSQVEALQLGGYADIVVTFNSLGGSIVSPIFVSLNDKINPPTDPVRDGYIFKGWYKNENCTEAWNYDSDVITGNITLFAKWEQPEVPANYPEPIQSVDVEAKQSYDFEKQGITLDAAWLNDRNIKRAIHRNGKLYILTKDAQPKILVVDPASLEITKELNLTGIADGITPISDIAFTADNILLACNKQQISVTDGVRYFKVYSWKNDDAIPELYFQLTDGVINANWTEAIVGETMAVSGPSWDATIYVPAVTVSSSKQIRIVGISKKLNVTATTKYMMNTSEYTEALWGIDFQFMVSPRANDCFILTSNIKSPTEYQFDMSKPNRDPLINKGVFAETGGYNLFKTNGANYFRYANHIYMASPVAKNERIEASAIMFDITNGLDKAVKLSTELPNLGIGAVTAPYMTTYATVDNANITIALLAENQGFTTFKTTGLLSVESVQKGENISVYPNPTHDIVNINSSVEIKSITLYDLSGCIVMEIPTHNTSFNLSALPSGNYILRINSTTIKLTKK